MKSWKTVLARFSSKLAANSQPKHILAVKLADFGDALLVEPALRALHLTYPFAKIDVLTTRNALPALERLPYLHKLILFDKYQFDNPRAALRLANLKALTVFGWQLLRARYDTVIFFHHLTTRWGALKFAALALSTLARLRVGLANQTGRAWFLNRVVPDQGFGWQSERLYWLQLAETLGGVAGSKLAGGFNGVEFRPWFILNQGERQQAQVQVEQLRTGQANAPVVILYPGSGPYALTRRWLPLRFAQVADTLVERFGAKIVILGSQAETEVATQVQSYMRYPATLLTGRTTLYEAGALLEECDLFIGNDGGLMHLAAVMGAATVAIFGPTNAQAWWPFGGDDRVTVVQAEVELPCRPCLYRGLELGQRYGCAPRPCLTEISVAQVVAAASKMLLHSSKLNFAKTVD